MVNALGGPDIADNRTDIASRIYGGNDMDHLYGGSANDRLEGEGGEDYLEGGRGNDDLIGGVENDHYLFVGSTLGTDVVHENASQDDDQLIFEEFAGPVNIDLASTAEQVINPTHLRLRLTSATGIEDVYGSAYADTIRGNSRDNVLIGGGGNDAMYGLSGRDALWGYNGDDDLFGGADDDTLQGGDGNDDLYGEAGLDTLSGSAGNDLLDGGYDWAQDVLTGGPGQDTFRRHAKKYWTPWGHTTVYDEVLENYNGADDVITKIWH